MPRRADLSAPAGFVRDRKINMRRGYLLTSHHDSRTESAVWSMSLVVGIAPVSDGRDMA